VAAAEFAVSFAVNFAAGPDRRFGTALALSIVFHLGTMAVVLPPRRTLPLDIPTPLSVRLAQEPVAFVSEPPQPARPAVAKPAHAKPAHRRREEAPPAVTAAPQTLPPAEAIQAVPAIEEAPVSAPELVAPPPIAAPLAPMTEPVATLAPAPVQRAPSAELIALYTKNLSELFARYKEYPRIAELRGWEGSVTMRLRVARSGRLIGADVLKSSGYDALDKQAIAMVSKAGVLPVPPAGLNTADFAVLVPIDFRLER
jgi:protein TonB